MTGVQTCALPIYILGVGVTLSSNTVYEFNALFILTKTLGTTAHTIGIGFGGTSTINNILYQELGSNYAGGLSGGNTNSSVSQITINSTSNQTIIPSTSTASVFAWIRIFGTVSINAGGTFIPQYTLSAAPGGAYSTTAGSYFKIYPIGASGSNISVGTWA